MLDEGIYSVASEMGDAESISKNCVSRILRLALMSPDVLEAIHLDTGSLLVSRLNLGHPRGIAHLALSAS
jgi:hypothetical protein